MSEILARYNPYSYGAPYTVDDIFGTDSAGTSQDRLLPNSILTALDSNVLTDWWIALTVADAMRRNNMNGTINIPHNYPSGIPWQINAMTFQEYCDYGFKDVGFGGQVVSAPPEVQWFVNFDDPAHPDYTDPSQLASLAAEGEPGVDVPALEQAIRILGDSGVLPFLFVENVKSDFAYRASSPRKRCGLMRPDGPFFYAHSTLQPIQLVGNIEAPFGQHIVGNNHIGVTHQVNPFNRSIAYLTNSHLPLGTTTAPSLGVTRVHPISPEKLIENKAAEAFTSFIERSLHDEEEPVPWLHITDTLFKNVTIILTNSGDPSSFWHHVNATNTAGLRAVCNSMWCEVTSFMFNGQPLKYAIPASPFYSRPDTTSRPLMREGFLYLRELEAKGLAVSVTAQAALIGVNTPSGRDFGCVLSDEIDIGSSPAVRADDELDMDRGFRLEIPTFPNRNHQLVASECYPVTPGGYTYPRSLSRIRFSNGRSTDQFMGKFNTTVTNLDSVSPESKTFAMATVFDNSSDRISVLSASTTLQPPTGTNGWDVGNNITWDGTSLKQEIGTTVEYYSWTDLISDDAGLSRWSGSYTSGTSGIWYVCRNSPYTEGSVLLKVFESGGALQVHEGDAPLPLGETVIVSELHSAFVANNPETFFPLGTGYLSVPVLMDSKPILGVAIYGSGQTD